MNSLRMFVEGSTGEKHLFTCATNRPGQAENFRKHANWWMRTGYKSNPVDKQPCFPLRIVIEEYQDDTAID